ncbi:MAG: AbrB/MazE/SpoVT family DNA-binding domain-containing protein [Gemmatimonadota bacterium]
MNVTMDKFGRILIPKAIRQRLGLKAGTELWLDTKDHEVVLRPVSNESVLAEKDGLLVCTADLDTGSEDFDLIEHIRAVRGARTRALTS